MAASQPPGLSVQQAQAAATMDQIVATNLQTELSARQTELDEQSKAANDLTDAHQRAHLEFRTAENTLSAATAGMDDELRRHMEEKDALEKRKARERAEMYRMLKEGAQSQIDSHVTSGVKAHVDSVLTDEHRSEVEDIMATRQRDADERVRQAALEAKYEGKGPTSKPFTREQLVWRRVAKQRRGRAQKWPV